MTPRERADRLLLARGYFETRTRAQEAIAAGCVTADGAVVRKPSDMLPVDAEIVATAAHPYVSRGGVKLAHALDHFGIDPAGWRCLDVGSSTGGFTDVLLRRGAAHVLAVDTGRDQFHVSLRGDPRVTLMEGTDIRRLEADPAGPVALAVIDVSFIPLALVLPAVTALLAPRAVLVALVKPQFEAGVDAVGKGGVVRDAKVHRRVLEEIVGVAHGLKQGVAGLIASPLRGPAGNVEFLIWLRPLPAAEIDVARAIEAALAMVVQIERG